MSNNETNTEKIISGSKKTIFVIKHWKLITILVGIIFSVFLFISIYTSIIYYFFAYEESSTPTIPYEYEISEAYNLYYDAVCDELESQNMDTDYYIYILAMMECINNLDALDVMQVGYFLRTTATTSTSSINIGISELKTLLEYAGVDTTTYNEDDINEITIAIQAYAFSSNYIDYMNEQEYSSELTETFANIYKYNEYRTSFADNVMQYVENFNTLAFLPIWPVPSYYDYDWITQMFGNNGHMGIDIAAPEGTAVYAVDDGYVISASYHWSWGNNVYIEHNSVYNTRYAHLTSYVVQAGDYVNAGDLIGYVGSTGNSTGNHLHFEIYEDGVRIDPYPFISINLDENGNVIS